jgi:hypothetical protein
VLGGRGWIAAKGEADVRASNWIISRTISTRHEEYKPQVLERLGCDRLKDASSHFRGLLENIIYNSLHDLHLLLLLGSKHELRTDVLIKVLLAQSLELHGTLLEGKTLLVSVLCDLGGHVVANDRVKAGDKHKRLVEKSIDSLLISLKALNQVLLE